MLTSLQKGGAQMKIIHTADIHLDSPLSQVGDSAVRRHELLRAVADMAE